MKPYSRAAVPCSASKAVGLSSVSAVMPPRGPSTYKADRDDMELNLVSHDAFQGFRSEERISMRIATNCFQDTLVNHQIVQAE